VLCAWLREERQPHRQMATILETPREDQVAVASHVSRWGGHNGPSRPEVALASLRFRCASTKSPIQSLPRTFPAGVVLAQRSKTDVLTSTEVRARNATGPRSVHGNSENGRRDVAAQLWLQRRAGEQLRPDARASTHLLRRRVRGGKRRGHPTSFWRYFRWCSRKRRVRRCWGFGAVDWRKRNRRSACHRGRFSDRWGR
jgi:hypothetical protein